MTIHIPFPIEKHNMYVPDMTEHAALDENYEGTIYLENVAAASTNTVLNGGVLVNGTPLVFDTALTVDPNYGRNLVLTSADAAGVITVTGRDYLNQPMTEEVTIATNSGTSAKAFKFIDRLETSNVPGSISIGVGDELGLPFVPLAILREYVNGALAGSAGTLTAADAATATATTGDTRGTYAPDASPNGASDYRVKFAFNNESAGGLYGQEQA